MFGGNDYYLWKPSTVTIFFKKGKLAMGANSVRVGSLLGLMVLSAWAVGGAPPMPPEGWEIYVQKPQQSFGVWLPQKNRKVFQGEGSTLVKDVKVGHRVIECEIKGDVKFRVLALRLDLPKGETVDTQTMIEVGRDIYLKQFPGTLDKKEVAVKDGEFKGTEYRISSKDDSQARLRVMLYRVPKVNRVILYQISVSGTKDQIDGKTAKILFDSFRHAGNVSEYGKKGATDSKAR